MKNIKLKPWVVKVIWVVISLLVVAAFAFMTIDSDDQLIDRRVTIKAIAEEYKNKNNSYGVVSVKSGMNCFSGSTFMKERALASLFTDGSFDNVSCIYGFVSGTPVIDSWSVSLIKYGTNSEGKETATVQCVDSLGGMYETPGLTTSVSCKTE